MAHQLTFRIAAFRSRILLGLLVLLALICLSATAFAEPVTLTFLFRGGSLQQQLVSYWIDEFERENPDIRVEWQIATSSNFQGDLPLMIATGTGPDVFEMWGGDAKNLADNGFLMDLNPYVARDYSADDLNDFFPISWQAGELLSGPRQGIRYGIPSYANVFIMYYNKDMFSAAGVPFLPEVDSQSLWTWDTLVDIGKKLTRRDADRIIQWALDDDSFIHPTGRGAGWIHAAGGKVFDIPSDPTHFMLDQPEAVQALQFMQDLIWKHELVPPMHDRAQAHFHAGKSAMNLWMGTAWLGTLDERVGNTFEWDMGPRPVGPGGSRGYYLASDMFGISANTAHPEAAWRFVQYLTSKQGMEAHMRVMGRAPVRRSAYPAYAEQYAGVSTQYFVQGMLDGVLSPESFMSHITEARDLIWKAVRDNIVTNKMPAEQAVGQIADAVRALYR